MPHTLQYRPILIDTLISNERIQSYQTVFQPPDDTALMGVYLWNAHVCGAFYPLISAAEVTLRNAIDHALVAGLGRFWWTSGKLHYRSFIAQAQAPHAVKALRENFALATRAHLAEQRRRPMTQRAQAIQHSGVIAKTAFSTWEFILDREFLGRGLMWPRHMPQVFRGQWPAPRAGVVLDHARHLVSTLRDFRNRLSHHEPIWKRYGVSTETDALRHLLSRIDTLESLLRLIHPDALRVLHANGLPQAARRACSAAEIKRFQQQAHTYPIQSLDKLATLVDRSTRENVTLPAIMRSGRRRRRFLILPH
ncbi:hypothetical protein [Achromobacter insuavis]|uniref:Abi-like family protein 1 n=2 Tax=Achromobacter insuavis TaxID=1287735 RepID=F7T8E5_9BURK|nr:hypothetical protein [Achromobacter insuavis]EGP43430.1 Abi-like family protein 1 [Achromobacter insuavis AXX-A]